MAVVFTVPWYATGFRGDQFEAALQEIAPVALRYGATDWTIYRYNDDHNTFDGVAAALARTLPGVSIQQGYAYADAIHNAGQAMVWAGMKEPAELYWAQLNDAGLTMAPLEQG